MVFYTIFMCNVAREERSSGGEVTMRSNAVVTSLFRIGSSSKLSIIRDSGTRGSKLSA